MSDQIKQVIEGTIVLIVLYLILSNAFGFASVVRAVGGVYTESVRTLQGR